MESNAILVVTHRNCFDLGFWIFTLLETFFITLTQMYTVFMYMVFNKNHISKEIINF